MHMPRGIGSYIGQIVLYLLMWVAWIVGVSTLIPWVYVQLASLFEPYRQILFGIHAGTAGDYWRSFWWAIGDPGLSAAGFFWGWRWYRNARYMSDPGPKAGAPVRRRGQPPRGTEWYLDQSRRRPGTRR